MSDHEWCRDVRRDEAVRAAEDAAAVPSIQHRDLPEQVALLWASLGDIIGRVVRLEGEMDAGADLTAERDAALRERDAAKEECERLGHIVSKYQETRQWDIEKIEEGCVRICFGDHHRAADCDWEYFIKRRAAQEEVEDWSRRCARILDERDAARARVAELEAAAPPRGWLTAEEREAVEEAMVDYASNVGDHDCERIERVLRALLAREKPPRVKVPHLDDLEADERPVWESACHEWIAAIRAAGGEVE